MQPKPSREEYPLWVRMGLWGVTSRASLWVFFWLSLLFAVGGCLYGVRDPRGFLFVVFLGAALMYWLTIRWVDRHGRWD